MEGKDLEWVRAGKKKKEDEVKQGGSRWGHKGRRWLDDPIPVQSLQSRRVVGAPIAETTPSRTGER